MHRSVRLKSRWLSNPVFEKLLAAWPVRPGSRHGVRRCAFLGHRRHLAVGRIDDHPRAVSLHDLAAVAEFRKHGDAAGRVAGQELLALVGLPLPVFEQLLQLGAADVVHAPAFEAGRSLHRRPLLVLVRENAGDVGIAPRRLRWSPSRLRRNRRLRNLNRARLRADDGAEGERECACNDRGRDVSHG